MIAAAGQWSGGAGAGAWATTATAGMAIGVMLLAYRQAEKDITRSDWICLLAALAAIPLWMTTKSPLWSMILITVIDQSGFIPTFRKSWKKPWQEPLITYLMSATKHGCSLLAMSHFSLITSFYPFVLMLMNFSFFAMTGLRRLVLQQQPQKLMALPRDTPDLI